MKMKRYKMFHKIYKTLLSVYLDEKEHEEFLSLGWEDIAEEEFLRLEKELHNGL